MKRDEENRRIGFWLMKDVGIDYNTIIYHYMNIKHLCEMLDNGSFYIKRKCDFEDKYEQEMLKKNRWFAFSAVGENVVQPNTEIYQTEINCKRDLFKRQSCVLTSCWSQGPYENYLMWKSYAPSHDGVCIKTTIGKFVKSLVPNTYHIWCGKMQYKNREQVTKIKDAEWMKMLEYYGENEIRFYFKKMQEPPYSISNNTNAVFIGIDCKKFIDRILLSPYMTKDDIKMWKDYISYAYNIEENKIESSSIEVKR